MSICSTNRLRRSRWNVKWVIKAVSTSLTYLPVKINFDSLIVIRRANIYFWMREPVVKHIKDNEIKVKRSLDKQSRVKEVLHTITCNRNYMTAMWLNTSIYIKRMLTPSNRTWAIHLPQRLRRSLWSRYTDHDLDLFLRWAAEAPPHCILPLQTLT